MRKIIFLIVLCTIVQRAYPQWTLLSNDFDPAISVTACDSTVIAGSSSFGICDLAVSHDCGNTWTGNNLLQSDGVEYLCIKDSMVYACTSSGIFRTNTNSLNWAPYNEGLPSGPIHKICFNDSVQLATGNNSIYKRIAGDTCWTTICESAPVIGISDFDFDGNLIVLAGDGIAESYDMGSSWTIWTDYIFEWDAVTIKGDTIIAASKGGIYRKLISTGNICKVSSGLIKLWNPMGYDYYGEFESYHRIGENIFLCGETGVYKLADDSWNWEHTGLGNYTYAMADNGEFLYAVNGYTGIWRRPVNQLIVNTNEYHPVLFSVTIYPNPAKDVLNIQFYKNNGEANLIIFDIHGNAMISELIQQEKTTIDIGNLIPGVYIIRLECNQQLLNRKMIVY